MSLNMKGSKMIRISVLFVFVLIELFNNEIKSQENNTQHTDEKYLVSNSTTILKGMKDTLSNDINYVLVDKMIANPDTIFKMMMDAEADYFFKTKSDTTMFNFKEKVKELYKNGYEIIHSKYVTQKIFFPITRRYIFMLFNKLELVNQKNDHKWSIALFYSIVDNTWKYKYVMDITDPILP